MRRDEAQRGQHGVPQEAGGAGESGRLMVLNGTAATVQEQREENRHAYGPENDEAPCDTHDRNVGICVALRSRGGSGDIGGEIG